MAKFAVLALVATSFPTTGFGQLGELPPSPLSEVRIDGVRAEISFDYLLDMTLVQRMIPAGLRVYPADTVIEGVEHRVGFGFASVGIVLADSMAINGRRLEHGSSEPPAMAFWWVWLDGQAAVADTRALGDQIAVELAVWYPDSAVVEDLRARGLPADVGRVTARPVSGGWEFELSLHDAEIRGRCVLEGERAPLSYPLPNFHTVWKAGPDPATFTVFTAYGHHEQRCRPTVEATGNSPLAVSLRRAPNFRDLAGSVHDGWHAVGRTYRHN